MDESITRMCSRYVSNYFGNKAVSFQESIEKVPTRLILCLRHNLIFQQTEIAKCGHET